MPKLSPRITLLATLGFGSLLGARDLRLSNRCEWSTLWVYPSAQEGGVETKAAPELKAAAASPKKAQASADGTPAKRPRGLELGPKGSAVIPLSDEATHFFMVYECPKPKKGEEPAWWIVVRPFAGTGPGVPASSKGEVILIPGGRPKKSAATLVENLSVEFDDRASGRPLIWLGGSNRSLF